MANPTFVAAGTKTGSTGNAVPPLPTGHAADDLLLLICETRDTDAVTAPAGWNEITTVDSGSPLPLVDSTDATRLTIFWKIDGGSETDPTVLDPGNHIICAIVAFRGTDLTDPFNLIVTSVETTSNTTVTIAGGTTTVNDCTVIQLTSNTTDSASAQVSNWANGSLTSPGFFEFVDDFGNSNLGGGFAGAYGGKDTAGVVASASADLATAARDQNVMIALQPPQAGSSVYDQAIGHIATSEALHGVTSVATAPQAIGHVASGEALHGVTSVGALAQAIGHAASGEAVRGLTTPATAPQAIGHVSSAVTLRGVGLAATATVSIGHVSATSGLFGLTLTIGGSTYQLDIGKVRARAGATVKLGVSNQVLGGQDLHAVEAMIGRKFVALRQNQGITTHGWTGAAGFADDDGYNLTYRDIQLDDAGSWANVPLGTYDSDLTAIFSAIIADGHWGPFNPAYCAFTHETSIAGDGGAGTAQEYIDAHRYVRLFADAAGASMWSVTGEYIGGPIIWVYVGWDRMFVDVDGNTPPDVDQAFDTYDPNQGTDPAPTGTSYYEGIGSDVYNDIAAGVLKYGADAATLLQPIYDAAVSRGCFWMIGEWACADGATTTDHENKADWIDSFRAFIEACPSDGPGSIPFVCSTVKISASNYQPDSSAESLAAWRRLALSETFSAGLDTAYGLALTADLATLAIGHVSTAAALRGLALPVVAALGIGHVASGEALHGVTTPLTAPLSIGHVASGELLHGLDLAAVATLSIGHIASLGALHGLDLPAHLALDLGHIASGLALHGVTLTLPQAVALSLIVPCYNGSAMTSLFSAQYAAQLAAAGYVHSAPAGDYTVPLATPSYEVEL